MALSNFIDKVTTVPTAWFNSIDVLWQTVFGGAATPAAARTALTSDAPMSIGQGGTGATTAGAARMALGSTATGDALFTAATAAAARTTLGSTTVGDAVFIAATQAAAQSALGVDVVTTGSFTPSLGGSTTYIGQTGSYTKIGRMVLIELWVKVNVIGTGSANTISGLPFVPNASFAHYIGVASFTGLAVNVISLWGSASSSSGGTIQMNGLAAAASGSAAVNVFGNSAEVFMSGMYYV